MYAKHFTDEEIDESAATPLGKVEAEIRICRMRLSRALAAENEAKDTPELEEIVKRDIAKVAQPPESDRHCASLD
jgi:hypothetical protein